MLDFDGNANGSWPDPVAWGQNAPVRHWIVGNIPGDLLRGSGYLESGPSANSKTISVVQPCRYPHIPVVSDRYAVYVFQQEKKIDFAALPDSITNFDAAAFLEKYQCPKPPTSLSRYSRLNRHFPGGPSTAMMFLELGTKATGRGA
ncbi:MAG: hypothetical protein WCD52_07085 [Xanthobacteraceae bacterium]